MQRKLKIILAVTVGIVLIGAVIATVLVFTVKGNDGNKQKKDAKVRIKNGEIIGLTKETFYKKKQFYSFQGIPYAEPPINELRFVKPVPIGNWNGTLSATKFQNDCVQMNGTIGSEDCLYINVYTPSLTDSKLPVMFWIYGGVFIKGGSQEFGPDTFIDEDVILVTFNYRVGIFGFMTTEDDIVPGNAGIKDQVLALQWVNENIEFFGGDPNKVTIFGESAGAASVSYLLQVPRTKGLYRAAIMESGSSLNLWSLGRDKVYSLYLAAKVLNISWSSSEELVYKLRQVDPQRLAISTVSVEAGVMILDNPFNGLLFSPSLEPMSAEAVIVNKSFEILTAGAFNQVPILMGLNSEEGLLFYDTLPYLLIYVNKYFIMPSQFVPISMHINDDFIAYNVGNEIKDRYFNISLNFTCLKEEITRFISEHQFERPIFKAADLYSQFTDVYFYKYSFYENHNRTIPGAAHAEEVDILFAPNKTHTVLSEKMVKLWTNFAKNMNPTPKKDPILENIIWEKFDKSGKYLNIDQTLTMTSNSEMPLNNNFQFWDDLFTNYGIDLDTY